jgi:ferritin-like metal-binding protein YciE
VITQPTAANQALREAVKKRIREEEEKITKLEAQIEINRQQRSVESGM